MSGNFSARTNSQTGFSAATRRSLPQHARLGTASSLTRPALPQSEPASGPSSIMIKGGWYKYHGVPVQLIREAVILDQDLSVDHERELRALATLRGVAG